MKHLLTFLLVTSLFVIGCGNYVTQDQLGTTVAELRTGFSDSTTQKVGYAHECSMSLNFAQDASQTCMLERMHGISPEDSYVCTLVHTWTSVCVEMDEARNLLPPQESVLDRLDAVQEAWQERGSESTENTR